MRINLPNEFKVIIIGDAAVGKTSIIQQFCYQTFEKEVESTVGSLFVSKEFETEDGKVQLNIWDTAGQEKYRSLIPMYSRNAAVGLIVIDATNKVSYESKETWLDILLKTAPKCKVFIVVNKIDLPPVIPIEEIKSWADSMNYPCFETSAKDYKSVYTVFKHVAEEIQKSSKQQENYQVNDYVQEVQVSDSKCSC